jgi:hypothetical protein
VSDPDVAPATWEIRAFSRPDNSTNMQMYPTRYPHLETRSCNVFAPLDSAAPDISVIGKTAGLRGEILDAPKGPKRGIWSFIGADGEPVTINALVIEERIMQLNMSTSRRAAPQAS